MVKKIAAAASYLALSVDADVQRISLAACTIDDCRRTFRVEVIALGQAVERAGLHATCRTVTHCCQALFHQINGCSSWKRAHLLVHGFAIISDLNAWVSFLSLPVVMLGAKSERSITHRRM